MWCHNALGRTSGSPTPAPDRASPMGVRVSFPRGLSHLCPTNFSTVSEKTAMLTCKITLPDLPHAVIINKNPGFRALYLARQNEFRFFWFNKYKKIFFLIFGCWLLSKKFSFCPKNNGFARVWVAAAPSTPWLVRLWLRLTSQLGTSKLTVHYSKMHLFGTFCLYANHHRLN